ncbi:hypothetical protein [Bergeyella sp. RCAD1439]|uniref:hypothetical protein n=1 Tax=Bergeyella anatis TaxID=3113737 RepID=UPI002E16D122|nr:hypothetical protein [Bergeyella sp. RCAD1439]
MDDFNNTQMGKKFSYASNRLYFNLLMGVLWVVIGAEPFFEQQQLRWRHYLTIFLGGLYLAVTLYEYRMKYFEIARDRIKVFGLFPKEMSFDEITKAQYFAGDYVFKTAHKKMKIVKSQIKASQRSEFEVFFKALEERLRSKIQL